MSFPDAKAFPDSVDGIEWVRTDTRLNSHRSLQQPLEFEPGMAIEDWAVKEQQLHEYRRRILGDEEPYRPAKRPQPMTFQCGCGATRQIGQQCLDECLKRIDPPPYDARLGD